MSLDVYLTIKGTTPNNPGSGIFVRDNGQTKEISRAEWDEKFPDRKPIMVDIDQDGDEVYDSNITHNLGTMAGEAGIYYLLWRPEDIGISKAGELIDPLCKGLDLLKSNPERFKAFNPKNGWGDYDGLVNFVEEYLAACTRYPAAEISVSR